MNIRVGEPEEQQRRRACKRVCLLENGYCVLHGRAGRYCNTMKIETIQFFETSGTTFLTTRRHIPENLHLQVTNSWVFICPEDGGSKLLRIVDTKLHGVTHERPVFRLSVFCCYSCLGYCRTVPAMGDRWVQKVTRKQPVLGMCLRNSFGQFWHPLRHLLVTAACRAVC
jgi:hypothetical protein